MGIDDDTFLRGRAEPPPSICPGDVLGGRFRIERPLGEGGMGAVFLATRLDSAGEPVAIKVLTLASASRRFENEARALLNLRSPHTLRVIELGRMDDGGSFLVTEYLEGRTLQAAIDERDLCDRDLLAILREVALALEEAHRLGIVHRDLKPTNIFLERFGAREHAKVLDFGIAKILEPSGPHLRVAPLLLEQPTMGPIGSPMFMAPEQCRGEAVTPAADLFAFGLVAYHAFSRSFPYDYPGGGAQAVLFAHASRRAKPLVHHWRGGLVEPGIAALVDALLEPVPQKRLGPVTEVIERLEALLDESRGAARPDAAVPSRPRAARRAPAVARYAPLFVPMLAAAAVVAGVAAASGRLPGLGHGPAKEALPGAKATKSTDVDARRAEPEPRPEPAARASPSSQVLVTGFEDLAGSRDESAVRAALGPALPAIRRCASRRLARGEAAELRFRSTANGVEVRVKGASKASALEGCLSSAKLELSLAAPAGSGAAAMIYLRCRVRRT